MKDCNTILPELVAYTHKQLAAAAAARVEQHLRTCPSCQVEAGRLERLDRLLMEYVPSLEPSATFASTFANRLAAEIVAEDAAPAGRRFLGWLLRPWLIPVVATAALVAIFLSPGLKGAPPKSGPATVARRDGGLSSATGEAVLSRKETQDAVVALPRKVETQPGRAEVEMVMASPPRDLIDRPELFLDYPVISELDVLEAADTISSGGAG